VRKAVSAFASTRESMWSIGYSKVMSAGRISLKSQSTNKAIVLKIA
jgi:hypothetical protein